MRQINPLLLLPFLLLGALPATAQQRPTVIELFTSQGCSSCPPADALLIELQRADPSLLALDLHVTYWDRLGWKDPYSLPAVTQRQRQFSAQLGLDTIYTPQIVVDGRQQAIGSDRAAVHQAIARARADATTVPLTLTAEAAGLRLHAGPGTGRATLILVGFDRQHATPVHAGENGGRTLNEINVVRAMAPVATWSGAPLDLTIPRPEGERVAALLQAPDGRILGAVAIP